jgi:hypothetical protein
MSPWLVNGSASLERPSTSGRNALRELITTALPSRIIPAAPITALDLLNEASADVSLNCDETLASAPYVSFNSSRTMA